MATAVLTSVEGALGFSPALLHPLPERCDALQRSSDCFRVAKAMAKGYPEALALNLQPYSSHLRDGPATKKDAGTLEYRNTKEPSKKLKYRSTNMLVLFGSRWLLGSACGRKSCPDGACTGRLQCVNQSINPINQSSVVVFLSAEWRSSQNCPVHSTMARSFESLSCPLSHFARPEFFVQTLQLAEAEMARKTFGE